MAFNDFFQRDDLNKRKAVKTNRTGLGVNVNWNHSQSFGAAFAYNSFFVFQLKGLKQLNDTTKLLQLQNTFLVAPHYTIINTKAVHNVILSISYSRLDDLNRFTSKYSNNSTVNTNMGYTLAVSKITFSFTPSFNVLYSKAPNFELLNVGPSFAFSKSFWKNKISTATTITYTASRTNNIWNAHTINNSISLGIKIDKSHSLKYTNSVLYTKLTNSNTSEYRGELSYTYAFNYAVEGKKKPKLP